MKPFQLIIIGDEIIHGNRNDQHFVFFRQLLRERGLQLASIMYLPDNRTELSKHLQQSFATKRPTFITGGIGATPDDHTRQAAAQALSLPLARHPQAAEWIAQVSAKRGDAPDSDAAQQRLHMADFPEGATVIPNPYNNIAGFAIQEHYFLPGFPVMAHPMAQWVLETHYAEWFHSVPRAQESIWLFDLPESAIAPLMKDIETRHMGIQSFSLPSVGSKQNSVWIEPHIEFGLKAEGDDACAQLPQIWAEVQEQLLALGGRLQRTPTISGSLKISD